MAVKQAGTVAASHTAGIFADMSLDGPEIGTLVAVIDRARNLPNRKTMGKQDPYCAMRLGKEAKKTDTDRRGGQTPKWDQELRFTVHESPDYYKLKCSVFNDDKKTDLIGEAWIDLREVVVSGGGQNDLWHQLNFKGKYAGEIRIELTFYDTRPIPEAPAEKRRQRSSQSVVSDNTSMTSGARRIGPREIARRPLPPDPGTQTPLGAVSVTPQQHILQSHPPYSQPMDDYSQQYALPPPPQVQQMYNPPEMPDDFEYQHSSTMPMELYDQPDSYNYPQDQDNYFEPENSIENDFHQQEWQSFQVTPRSSAGVSPHSFPDREPTWKHQSSPISPRTMSTQPPVSHYTSSASARPSPTAIPATIPRQQPRPQTNSVSPVKHVVHRDSPLRQSMNHNDMPLPQIPYTEPCDGIDEPPPPPAHWGSIPRPGGLASQQHAPRESQGPFTPSKNASDEDRSPLQTIEHHYSPQQVSPSARPVASRQSGRSSHSRPSPDPPEQTRPPNARRGSLVGEFPAPHQLSQNYGIDLFEEPVEQDRQGRYLRRLSSNEAQDRPFQPPGRAHTYDSMDVFDERNTYRSEPQVVRPRAVSPHAGHTVPRKSVSPHPYSREDGNRTDPIPFGPDSYDVHNPGSSPFGSSYGTPELSNDRHSEAQKIQDQAPIIGNDGRIIDPSDHLPSDTWAPEPERKDRKPEHVIRFRTKDVRAQSGPTSPHSSRPVSASVSPYQSSPYHSSPNLASVPPSPYRGSPNAPPIPAPSSGRNRLQKQMPARPLPTQPFSHAHTSPAAIPQSTGREHLGHTPQRSSLHSSPASGRQQRPPLSDHQVPTTNHYSPGGSYNQQQLPTTPTRMPQQRPKSFAYGGPQDSLAAELSMIDIGPSRTGGRTAVRQNRGYGGY